MNTFQGLIGICASAEIIFVQTHRSHSPTLMNYQAQRTEAVYQECASVIGNKFRDGMSCGLDLHMRTTCLSQQNTRAIRPVSCHFLSKQEDVMRGPQGEDEALEFARICFPAAAQALRWIEGICMGGVERAGTPPPIICAASNSAHIGVSSEGLYLAPQQQQQQQQQQDGSRGKQSSPEITHHLLQLKASPTPLFSFFFFLPHPLLFSVLM
ncbi:hypothetical protein F7725_016902 [Dissostichus mawsoni]|uniref:Uncharacterized protein n=1 Tax=Dissostichus mawsoni TaxID=36200 RepID=A0A7J5Z523_DISMA|nr:hypothetical protein F7725_016902 [Dissostichus mawsoni]